MGLFKSKIFIILTYSLLLFFVFSFSFHTDHSFDQDLGRHIKLGEIIVNTKSVPKNNLFSYTYPQFPFINHHYLFEVLVYLGQQSIGLQGLLWIKIILLLLSVSITFLLISKSNYLIVLPISFIFLHVLRDRTDLRPEIFSFLFASLSYYLLEKFEKTKGKIIYFLPLIQFLWINMHIYFFIGFILQIIFLFNFYLKKQFLLLKTLGFIFVASILISLLNPNGLNSLIYPLTVFNNYGYSIAENQSIFLLESINFKSPDFIFAKISSAVIILSIFIVILKKSSNFKNIFLPLFGLILALFHVRSFPYLVFLALPETINNLSTINLKIVSKIIWIICILFLIYESIFYLNGNYYKLKDLDSSPSLEFKENARNAMDFITQNNLPNPIFNNFDIGSYIIYRGYPKYHVFVDGRPESYPNEFFKKAYIPVQENPNLFYELDQKINFKTIIFSHTDQTPWGKTFLKFITKDQSWKIVYLDNFMIVLVKNEIVKNSNLKVINLYDLNLENYQFKNHVDYERLSVFLLNNEATKSANLFAKKAIEIFPDSPIANLLMIINPDPTFAPLYSSINKYKEKSTSSIWW